MEINKNNATSKTPALDLPTYKETGALDGIKSVEASLERMKVVDVLGNEKAPSNGVSLCDSLTSKSISEICKLDVALEAQLKDENIPVNTDATTIETEKPNPYHNWECGFGFLGEFDASEQIPSTTAEFLKAVKGEIATTGAIQNGLNTYLKKIDSKEHHNFSEEFLKDQTDATHRTIGQLFHIANNLQDVVQEVEAVHGDSNEVKAELRQAFAHALPWIKRSRAILVSAHVFYKINYVLSSDKAKA